MTNEQVNTLPFNSLLKPDDFDLAEGKFELQSFSKDNILLKEGHICRRLYFIIKGLAYACTPAGQILWYEYEGNSFTDLQSLYTQTPSKSLIKIAEDKTIIQSITYRNLQELYEKSHRWALWGVRFQENELVRITKYYEALRTKDATQRYFELIEVYPQILQRIPLGHIASYLGISQVSLSRIRAGVQKK